MTEGIFNFLPTSALLTKVLGPVLCPDSTLSPFYVLGSPTGSTMHLPQDDIACTMSAVKYRTKIV